VINGDDTNNAIYQIEFKIISLILVKALNDKEIIVKEMTATQT